VWPQPYERTSILLVGKLFIEPEYPPNYIQPLDELYVHHPSHKVINMVKNFRPWHDYAFGNITLPSVM